MDDRTEHESTLVRESRHGRLVVDQDVPSNQGLVLGDDEPLLHERSELLNPEVLLEKAEVVLRKLRCADSNVVAILKEFLKALNRSRDSWHFKEEVLGVADVLDGVLIAGIVRWKELQVRIRDWRIG